MSEQFSSPMHKSLQALAKLLTDKQLKLTTAESCTGGMLSQEITSISGSSKWFECGFVTYSNDSKIKMLGVQSNVLDKYGAVSEQVAEQMVLGALSISTADIGVSITGIAGPSGGSANKPVGTVYIAIAGINQQAKATCCQFGGNRKTIREQAIQKAITLLIEQLRQRATNG